MKKKMLLIVCVLLLLLSNISYAESKDFIVPRGMAPIVYAQLY